MTCCPFRHDMSIVFTLLSTALGSLRDACMRLKHAGSLLSFQSWSGRRAGALGAATGAGEHPGETGQRQRAPTPLLQPAWRVPGARLGQAEGRAHSGILPALRCCWADDQSTGSLQPCLDVNMTLAVTQQPYSSPSLPLPTADQVRAGTVIWGWWNWALPRAGESREGLAELEAALTSPQPDLYSCLHAVGSWWR